MLLLPVFVFSTSGNCNEVLLHLRARDWVLHHAVARTRKTACRKSSCIRELLVLFSCEKNSFAVRVEYRNSFDCKYTCWMRPGSLEMKGGQNAARAGQPDSNDEPPSLPLTPVHGMAYDYRQ